jgi:DNA-binding NarL/FixJ family response regulator
LRSAVSYDFVRSLTKPKVQPGCLHRPEVPFFPAGGVNCHRIRGRASGSVTKSTPIADFLEAVRKTGSGGLYVSLTIAVQFALRLDENDNNVPHRRLSDREFDVFCRIASEQPITAIAWTLSLSTRTINTYRARIFEKMEMPHEVALIRYALPHKLVEDSDSSELPIAA